MVEIHVWLPLSGRLISRDNKGSGDPVDPITFPTPIDLGYDVEAANEEFEPTMNAVEFDWDNKQVYVRVVGTPAFVNWLSAEAGMDDVPRGTKISQAKRAQLLARVGRSEMTELPGPPA